MGHRETQELSCPDTGTSWAESCVLGTRKKVFTTRVVAQTARRGGGSPVPANIQGQAGLGFEPPDPIGDVPAHCRGLG